MTMSSCDHSRASRSARVVGRKRWLLATRALVHAARTAGPGGLAQLELLELARGGAHERVAQLDRGRALVVRHAAAAVLDEIAIGGGGAGSEHHERLDRLAPLLV